jgi:energy-coupling factor transporter ATP-binding protein EcfA2
LYIQRVRIQNIRGFKDVNLDFTRPEGSPAGWTVLAGRNGSGKSTLLKAVALAVTGTTRAHALYESLTNWVRRSESNGNVEALIEPSLEDGDTGVRVAHLPYPLSLAWKSDEPGVRGYFPLSTYKIGDQLLGGPWSPNSSGWFLAAYGPYRRLTGHASDVQRLMESPHPIARIVNLFREDASLVESVTWLRDIYLRRLEGKQGAEELEQAVLRLLNDGLLPGEAQVEGIDSDGLWVQQHGVRLPLKELSDGYRTMAALVLDIVRHLHNCFGRLRIETARDEEGEFQRILHSGVVLIDEMETHLHVSWQKRVGFWLKRHFPNIQFIVTTHSPFICQAADPRGLIRLPAPGEDRPVEHVSEDLYNTVVNGGVDDAVLTELFGLETPYSEEARKLRERVAELEAQLQTGKATRGNQDELTELRSRLPRTMTADVEQALRKLAIDA